MIPVTAPFQSCASVSCNAGLKLNEAIVSHTASESRLVLQQDPARRSAVVGASSGPGTPQHTMHASHAAACVSATGLILDAKEAPMPGFGVLVSEKRHGPGFSSVVLRQDFSEFLLVTAGQARLEGGGRVFHLVPGSFVHAPALTDYHFQNKPSQPVTLYTIQYREGILSAWLTRQLSRAGILHWNLYRAGPPLLRVFPPLCKEMLHEQYCRQVGWETMLVARLADLVVHTTRYAARQARHYESCPDKFSDSLARVANYAICLQSEFHHSTTLDEAARATGLSRRRFTALFRSITGQSWHKHLLGLRLNHARQLLSHTDKIILSVAFESGFDDLSHFNHVFRQVVGCSPSAFRTRSSEDRDQPAPDGSPLREDNRLKEAAFTAAITPGPWMARQLGFRR